MAERLIARRSVLRGAAAVAASPSGALPATGSDRVPLWRIARRRGLVFGSSAATWQLSDPDYRRLFTRQAGALLTEDDLLWYRLRPTPDSALDFSYGDQIVAFAEQHGMPGRRGTPSLGPGLRRGMDGRRPVGVGPA